ncbi:MAG: DUF4209 domain-containing protein, partial [Halanaerobiales bacterium]
MQEFSSINDIYNHIEEHALDYDEVYKIASLFIDYRDTNCNDEKELKNIQWEIDTLRVVIRDGEVNPIISYTGEEGEVFKYPSLSNESNIYEYIESRFNKTENPLLIAQYGTILWNSPKKHFKFVKEAIESFLLLSEIYEQKDIKFPDKHYGLKVIRSIKNSFFLSSNAKYKIDNIKEKLMDLIWKFNDKSSSLFVLRKDLIELMLEEKKYFKSKDFSDLDKMIWDFSNKLQVNKRYFNAIKLLALGESISQKLQTDSYGWNNKIAELYEVLMSNADQNNNPTAITYCQYAIQYYQTSHNENKVKDLYKKHEELKDAMPLFNIGTEIDLTEEVNSYKKHAKEYVRENSGTEIIDTLMYDITILPLYSKMSDKADKDAEQYIFQSFFNSESLDEDGHTAQHFSDEKEKKYFNILKYYKFEILYKYNFIISFLIYEAIKKKEISYDIILNYLKKNSWYGKTLERNTPNNEKVKYNWLNLIAPSIYDYFEKLNTFIANKGYYPNLVLCIDSLTVKIEGLLRDLCRYSGGTVIYRTEDKEGRGLFRKKDINSLLYDDKIKELFSDDDLLFLRFLLIEKAGFNFRNRIAHSLVIYREYSIEYMNLLLLALLRIGKFQFDDYDN